MNLKTASDAHTTHTYTDVQTRTNTHTLYIHTHKTINCKKSDDKEHQQPDDGSNP
jgi:hypothetical protein